MWPGQICPGIDRRHKTGYQSKNLYDIGATPHYKDNAIACVGPCRPGAAGGVFGCGVLTASALVKENGRRSARWFNYCDLDEGKRIDLDNLDVRQF